MGLTTKPVPGLGLSITVRKLDRDPDDRIEEKVEHAREQFDRDMTGGEIFGYDVEGNHIVLYYSDDTLTHEHLEAVEEAFNTHRLEVEVAIFEPKRVVQKVSDMMPST